MITITDNTKFLKTPVLLEKGVEVVFIEDAKAAGFNRVTPPYEAEEKTILKGYTAQVHYIYDDEIEIEDCGIYFYRLSIEEFLEKTRHFSWTPSRKKRKIFKNEEVTIRPWKFISRNIHEVYMKFGDDSKKFLRSFSKAEKAAEFMRKMNNVLYGMNSVSQQSTYSDNFFGFVIEEVKRKDAQ